jgi:hypothetical protein
MNVRKLKNFAKFISSIPKSKFKMNTFSEHPKAYEDVPDIEKVVNKNSIEHTCKTSCCLAGWAVVRSGYGLVDDDDVVKVSRGKVDHLRVSAEQFATDTFELTEEEASKLFYPYSETWGKFALTPKGAAKRILHLIETGE